MVSSWLAIGKCTLLAIGSTSPSGIKGRALKLWPVCTSEVSNDNIKLLFSVQTNPWNLLIRNPSPCCGKYLALVCLGRKPSFPCCSIYSLDECIRKGGEPEFSFNSAAGIISESGLQWTARVWKKLTSKPEIRRMLMCFTAGFNKYFLPTRSCWSAISLYYKTQPCGLHSLLIAQINNLLEKTLFVSIKS